MSNESKCSCQHCSGHISFPTEMAGQMIVCPHCGLETKLYVPAIPQDVRVEIKRNASPLGIAALVLGIISCLFCWIPFLGLLAIPLALIGLLLALVGLIMAGVNKKTGFVFPVSGAVVCLLSVIIAVAITGGLATAFQNAVAQGRKPDSSSVTQGDMKVTVYRVHIGSVNNNDALGRPQETQDQFFTIYLAVANLSSTKKLDFQTWRGAPSGIGDGSAQLTDINGNDYKLINITPSQENGNSYPDSISIYPQKEVHDAVVFELPVENIEWLRLELPAENFGSDGMLRFEIPMGRFFAAREDVKKARADYDSWNGGDPYQRDAKWRQVDMVYESKLKAAESRLAITETNLMASP
jgi:hypothetical protein